MTTIDQTLTPGEAAAFRKFWTGAEAVVWDVYARLCPPVQCAPAVGVHQGCEHDRQAAA